MLAKIKSDDNDNENKVILCLYRLCSEFDNFS